ncbi:RNA polymerase sigma factor [Mucilaginibacter sp. SG564]|uniref:RNA polymerase sigma factor n=1 Tax=Mucilaginibacter sp. SG564 TaxID=2587022 RepID=UPI001553DFAA|nr:RNA polymerase sigma-70 factor [Mucilaginibacter sp. SG564]NOW95016.1 RNA polymerase sigma-70 factor (ECF subfamily) [Mucilaginibacter sp. SG564]
MDNLTLLGDDELLQRLQSGEKHAYKVIYDRYWPILFRHCRKMLQDDTEAQDITQEIFTMLWIKSNEVSIRPPLGAYLYTAVRNKVLDHLKNKKVKGKFLDSLKDMEESGDFITDSLIREKQLALEIEKEVAALPAKMRAVFELSRNENLCHKEIAEQLSISSNTVKKQISNALQILRGKLLIK